jgi:hypothetical protein
MPVQACRSGRRCNRQERLDGASVARHLLLLDHLRCPTHSSSALIGTVRREFLDHVLFWNTRHLERKLAEFRLYYDAARSHASLEGYTPLTFADRRSIACADLTEVRWTTHCRGLVQLPVAA